MFYLPPEQYTRDLDVVTSGIEDIATMLSIKHGKSVDYCREWLKTKIREGKIPFKDPDLKIVTRDKNGDRQYSYSKFFRYYRVAQDKKLIVLPTGTTNYNQNQRQSETALFIKNGIDARSALKKEAFVAEQAGDVEKYIFKNESQNSAKIEINSVSGGQISQSTILCFPQLHNGLTSTCRIMTAFTNGNNEKIISGIRAYHHPDLVISDFTRITNQIDLVNFEKMVEHYGLVYPSAKETYDYAQRSLSINFVDRKYNKFLMDFMEKTSPIQRAAFIYVGDLYGLRTFNPEFTRNMLYKLQRVALDGPEVTDKKAAIKTLNDEELTHVGYICQEYSEYKEIKHIDRLSPANANVVVWTAMAFKEALSIYEYYIRTCFTNDVMPLSQASFPKYVRDSGVGGDTDSTFACVMNWLQWWDSVGDDTLNFTENAIKAGHVIAFFFSSSCTHLLAKVSKNMGAIDELLFEYQMKSEFYFDVFVTTNRGKTYFANKRGKEGRLYDYSGLNIERKGAVLIASASPELIQKEVKNRIEFILQSAIDGKKINLAEQIQSVRELELKILDELQTGSRQFYRRMSIKEAASYKNPDPFKSNHYHHLFWESVFAPTYGHVATVPFTSIKINLDINNKTQMNAWVNSLPEDIKQRLLNFMQVSGRTLIKTIYVPVEITIKYGIPEEIFKVTLYSKIMSGLFEPFYVILESLGYYALTQHNNNMLYQYRPSIDIEDEEEKEIEADQLHQDVEEAM